MKVVPFLTPRKKPTRRSGPRKRADQPRTSPAVRRKSNEYPGLGSTQLWRAAETCLQGVSSA